VSDPWSPRPSEAVSSENTNGQIYPSLSPPPVASNDPWSTAAPAIPAAETQLTADVFAPVSGNSSLASSAVPVAQNDPWSVFETNNAKTSTQSNEIFPSSTKEGSQLASTYSGIPIEGTNGAIGQQRANVKTPENFLGENSALVNLDNLMGPTNSKLTARPATNPFLIGASTASTAAPTINPFTAQQRPSPSLNEMMQARSSVSSTTNGGQSQQPATNPFSLMS